MREGYLLNNKYHANFPNETYVSIEIPKGSSLKYERDVETGHLILDRVLAGGFKFPFNYGYIPHTLGDDGDPLDVVLFFSESIIPSTIVSCKVLGVLDMDDRGKKDYKFICCPTFCEEQDLSDVPKFDLDQVKYFFENYKVFFGGQVDVFDYQDRDFALELLKMSQK